MIGCICNAGDRNISLKENGCFQYNPANENWLVFSKYGYIHLKKRSDRQLAIIYIMIIKQKDNEVIHSKLDYYYFY